MGVLSEIKDACFDVAELMDDNKSELLLGVGLISFVGAVIATGFAAVKATDELREAQEELEWRELDVDEEPLTPKEELKEMAMPVVKSLRWYLISVGLVGLGTYSILKSRTILIEEYENELGVYAATILGIDKAFRTYRQRVIEDQGEEKDLEYRYGTRKEKIETEYEDEKGRKKTKKEEIEVTDDIEFTDTSKFFDDTCDGYLPDAESNHIYLMAIQRSFNKLLHDRYHEDEIWPKHKRRKNREKGKPAIVYLNEVYDELGIERTKRGQLEGWVYDPNDPVLSQTEIDFGMRRTNRANRRFINGLEPVVLLNFNCVPVIKYTDC